MGFACAGRRCAFVLHHETHFELAQALSRWPAELHRWVVSESAPQQALPTPYAAAWQAVLERKGANGTRSCAALASEEQEHARLRRVIRHGMQMYIQDANPDSYYHDIEHRELGEILDDYK